MFSLNKDLEAQDSFLTCIETGAVFDPRIRRECIKRLMVIQKKLNRMDMYNRLSVLVDDFKMKSKDIVFLVDEQVRQSSEDIQQKLITSL